MLWPKVKIRHRLRDSLCCSVRVLALNDQSLRTLEAQSCKEHIIHS